MSATSKRKKAFNKIGLGVCIFLLLFLSLFPFFWMLSTSLKTSKELYTINLNLIPKNPTLANYREAILNTPFFLFLRNSALVTISTVLLAIFISVFASYALTRFIFPGRRIIAASIVTTYLLPSSLLFIPLFQILVNLRIANTLYSLILAYLTFCVPFSTWNLMAYFSTIPKEIEESALVDGCSRVQTLFKIVLPLSAPGVGAVTLYSFTLAWNEYLYASVFITSEPLKTIPVGLADFLVEDSFYWGPMMAMALLTTIPITIVYVFLQRYLISGITFGAVKA